MSGHIMAKNARVSFPQLWRDQEKGNDVYPKGCVILLSETEHSNIIKTIKNTMAAAWSTKPKLVEQMRTLKANGKDPLSVFKGVCLRGPGEEGWRDEYPSKHMLLKANCKKGSKPVPVLLKNGQRATEETDQIYSGCRVNVKFEIWLQDNNYGRRINCRLIAIQFAGDDEPLDASHVPDDVATDGFDALPDDGLGGLNKAAAQAESSETSIDAFLD